MARPGPRAETGRTPVRYNATQHGILSPSPVVPGRESEEEWHEHHAGILASLAPEGQLEFALAERVSLLLWRLRRVVVYERQMIGVALPGIDERSAGLPLLPSGPAVDRIVRYEAHLNRQLMQTMHELEALQARRQGQATPRARLDISGMPET